MNADATARHERSLANRAHVRLLLAARLGAAVPEDAAMALAVTRYKLCPSCGGWRNRSITIPATSTEQEA